MTEEEDDDDDDPKIVKSRMSRFSRGKLEAGRNGQGLCTAKVVQKLLLCVFKAYLGVLAELEGVLYPDHVRFHSCHPYSDALMNLHQLIVTYV